MKKLIFWGITAVMMTACSYSEVLNQNLQSAISFGNSFVDNMTKATDITNENLDASNVFGVMKNAKGEMVYAFEQQRIESDGSYTPVQYWQKGANYWFTGIAPFVEKGATGNWSFEPALTEGALASNRGTLSFNNKTAQAQEDLLMCVVDAVSCTSTVNQPAVALNYGHQLARVKFHFGNAFLSDAYQLRFSNIKINNVISEASMVVADNASEWVATAGAERFVIPFAIGADQIPVGTFIESDHMYLIPNADNDGAKYNISFTVEVMQKGKVQYTYDFVEELSFASMKKAHSYLLSVDFNEGNVNPDPDPENPNFEQIKFTVSVDDWTDWGIDM